MKADIDIYKAFILLLFFRHGLICNSCCYLLPYILPPALAGNVGLLVVWL